jgi:hypothetical protein
MLPSFRNSDAKRELSGCYVSQDTDVKRKGENRNKLMATGGIT